MTRDEVLIRFVVQADAQPWGTDMAYRQVNLMADHIVQLETKLATVEAERDAEKQRRREIDDEAFVYAEQVEVMRRRALRAERILAALREPSEAVVDATSRSYDTAIGHGTTHLQAVSTALISAVAAAEQETSTETPRD